MLNIDFSQRLVIPTRSEPWQPSPANGVWRKPLEREAKESGHTTSIVKYEAGCAFSRHPHPFGEEIYVIEGVFSDEYGDYPAGTYLRNPPNSHHAPFSKQGCTIFVKLNQFSLGDSKEVRINTLETSWRDGIGGLKIMPMHSFNTEQVALVKWPENETFQPHSHFGGEEILVLSGTFKDEHGCYPTGTWIRSPDNSVHHPFVTEETTILVKTGHLGVSISAHQGQNR